MSSLVESLQEYRLSLDSAHARAARSGDPLNDRALLDLIERMIVDCVKGLLDDLAESAELHESAASLISKAGAAITAHEDRFIKDAPLAFLARQIEGLSQALRDIGYLREGFGLGGRQPKPADMTWLHGRAVESYVRDTMRQVAEGLKTKDADVERIASEVKLDLAAAQEGIVDLLGEDLGGGQFMDAVIELGKRETQVTGWDAFCELPYEKELAERSSFFLEVTTRQPPPAPLVGLYAAIEYPRRRGEKVADIGLTGSSDAYESDENEWFGQINYTPIDGYVYSEVLSAIHGIAYSPGGLGNAADYTLCLAWAAFFARACARRYLSEIGRDFIGLRVGFAGGDWIELGWVRRA